MKINPEFLRNYWLELTPHRLISMPAIILAILFLVYLGTRLSPASTYSAIESVSLAIYLLLTMIWGVKLSADAIVGEIRDKTWDMQRMTAVNAWSMTWGKLFGSTLFSWYGALIALSTYMYAALQQGTHGVWIKLSLLIATPVLVHAITLLASVLAIQRSRTVTKSASSITMLFGIFIAISVISNGLSPSSDIQWFSRRWASDGFILSTVLIFCGWSVTGLYRMLRVEFQYQNRPWVWLLFVIFLAAFSAGFVNSAYASAEELMTARLFTAFVVTLVLAYTQIFLDNKDPLIIRRLMHLAHNKHWLELTARLPGWVVTLVLASLFCLVLLLRDYPQRVDLLFKNMQMNTVLLSSLLLAYRDIAIVLYFNLSGRRKRADASALLYILILHLLLPAILLKLGLSDLASTLTFYSNSSWSVPGAAVQVIVVLILIRGQWKQSFPVIKT